MRPQYARTSVTKSKWIVPLSAVTVNFGCFAQRRILVDSGDGIAKILTVTGLSLSVSSGELNSKSIVFPFTNVPRTLVQPL
jgi:hypothetical protein